MANAGEDYMDKRLRWMEENIDGAYNAVHPPGHDHAGSHCTNSGTFILVCCYIEALGKVLMKGPGGSARRFQEFLRVCMSDFLSESNARTDLSLPGDHLLYRSIDVDLFMVIRTQVSVGAGAVLRESIGSQMVVS